MSYHVIWGMALERSWYTFNLQPLPALPVVGKPLTSMLGLKLTNIVFSDFSFDVCDQVEEDSDGRTAANEDEEKSEVLIVRQLLYTHHNDNDNG